MKGLLASLLLFFAISSICAEPPQNLRAAAISDDGFTLRWDAMDAVDGYDVEVWKLEDRFFTNFDSSLDLPAGWSISGTNTSIVDYTLAPSYTFSPNHAFRLYNPESSNDLSSVYLQIPISDAVHAADDLLVISYWIRVYKHSNNTNYGFKILTGSHHADDDEIGSYEVYAFVGDNSAFNTEYKQFSFPFATTGVSYLKLSYSYWHYGYSLIDDISIKAVDWDTSTQEYAQTVNYHACRINGLDQQSSYLYRVKPLGGEFSPWLIVSTLADNPAYGAGTAFAGYPAQIDLTAADIPQSISILPSAVEDADYQVQLSGEGNSFSYTISIDDANALAGTYTIQHPGHRSQNTSVAGAENPLIATESGTTTITISTPSRSAELVISLDLDVDTLPVELSYFQAQSISARSCRLDWRTESESNLLGYRVLRGADASPDMAELLSPLIPAQNSSQPRSYSFLDNSPDYPAYYYLMSLGLDGIEQISEPIFVDFQNPEQQLMDPNQNGFSIYPNPFNQKAILQLSLAWEQEIGLKLYDAKGRLLRSEALGRYPAGAHQIPFLATDNRGASLASGAYLIEVTFQNESLLGKIMLSK